MRRYILGGPEETDPFYLYIITDDDDLITETYLPSYRKSDATVQALVLAWQEYADSTGSPSGAQNIGQFVDYVAATYPDTYRVRRQV